MASFEDLTRLKRLAPVGEFTDAELGVLIDAKTVNGAAAELWATEASATASLVDISESGSSRKNSQAYDHAQKMAEYYANVYAGDLAASGSSAPTARTRVMRR